jgi:ParB family chromosome partitioning protein
VSRRAGLGRGLAALIPDSALDAGNAPASRLRSVPLDEVRPNPEQPRERFEASELEALAASIARHGVLQPLVVRRHEGAYVLVAGERRLRAAALAGLHEVPVVVRDAVSPAEQLELALVENLLRADLDPIEAARGYRRLVEEHGWTQGEVGERFGRDRSTISNAIRLLDLCEPGLDALREGRISAGHARALLPVGDARVVARLVARIEAEHLSVRATERAVARLHQPPAPEPPKVTYAYAARKLGDSLGTSVQIKPRKDGSGRIVVDFADAEDLERLLAAMRAR